MTLYRVEDYAFSKLRERYKKWTGNSFDNKDLVSFGLADEGGFLTNAGALIATKARSAGHDCSAHAGMDWTKAAARWTRWTMQNIPAVCFR